jgi:hypothetical protein
LVALIDTVWLVGAAVAALVDGAALADELELLLPQPAITTAVASTPRTLVARTDLRVNLTTMTLLPIGELFVTHTDPAALRSFPEAGLATSRS